MISKKLDLCDQINFFTHLSTLLNAGLPLLNSLVMIHQSDAGNQKQYIRRVISDLNHGSSLASSLANQGKFSPVCIGLIAVGEKTGELEKSLNLINRQLENDEALRRQMKQALTYPLITLSSAVLMVACMLIWVIPNFEEIFINFNSELPAITRLMLNGSRFIQDYFYYIVCTIIAFTVLAVFIWINSISFQKIFDSQIFRFPYFGNIYRLSAQISWCQNLAHLLQSGISILEALRITAQSSNHWLSHDLTVKLFKQLSLGFDFGDGLKRCDPQQRFFDADTVQLLYIGAKTGSLGTMLLNRSRALEQQLQHKLSLLGQSLEPFLIIFLGLLVGGLLLSLYLPIFSLGRII